MELRPGSALATMGKRISAEQQLKADQAGRRMIIQMAYANFIESVLESMASSPQFDENGAVSLKGKERDGTQHTITRKYNHTQQAASGYALEISLGHRDGSIPLFISSEHLMVDGVELTLSDEDVTEFVDYTHQLSESVLEWVSAD